MRRGKRRSGDRALWLASGVAIGAGLGWLTAPRRGNVLRNLVRQKLMHWRRVGERGAVRVQQRAHDLENRVQGSVAEWREIWSPPDRFVDANTLVDQVRSRLGRELASTFDHINLNAVGHTLFLHGRVETEAERNRLIATIADVEGVEEVRAEMLLVGSEHKPAGMPATGTAATPEPRARRRSGS